MRADVWGCLLWVGLAPAALGCHSSKEQSVTDEHFVACADVADCSQHAAAVACDKDGYCIDTAGERVVHGMGGEVADTSDAGGKATTTACRVRPEVCNGEDDDCDGDVDEAMAADPYCEALIVNAITFCDGDKGVCVPVKCLAGYLQCDGEPNNGCEPAAECDGSLLDGGTGDDAGL